MADNARRHCFEKTSSPVECLMSYFLKHTETTIQSGVPRSIFEQLPQTITTMYTGSGVAPGATRASAL